MTTTIFALVAAFVVAAVYLADPATANGRTNVNFGGPMGSFAQPPAGPELVGAPERARRPVTAPNSVRAVKHPPLPIRAIRQVAAAGPAQAAAATPRKVANNNEAKPRRQMVSVSAIAALEMPLAASAGQPQPREATKTAKAEKELSCKKYVAAAGLTITVPCSK